MPSVARGPGDGGGSKASELQCLLVGVETFAELSHVPEPTGVPQAEYRHIERYQQLQECHSRHIIAEIKSAKISR